MISLSTPKNKPCYYINNDLYIDSLCSYHCKDIQHDATNTIDKSEAQHLFESIYHLQMISGCEQIVAELTAKLEKEFEIAEIKNNKKYLNNLTYTPNGIISNPVKSGKKIIASPWEPEQTAVKSTKKVIDIDKKKTDIDNQNIAFLQSFTGNQTMPFFVYQTQIKLHQRIQKPYFTKNFAKNLKTIDLLLKMQPNERNIIKFDAFTFIKYTQTMISYISGQNTNQYFRHRNGILDKNGVDKIVTIMEKHISLCSDADNYTKYTYIISNLLDSHLYTDEKLIQLGNPLQTIIQNCQDCFNFTEFNDLSQIENWTWLKTIKQVYEYLYANEDMRPVYEKLGLIIKNYYPLQSI